MANSNRPYLVWIYALATFASAFLLFAVQPLLAKHLTPAFGGSAAVWTTSMMFFIVALLIGYSYVHFAARYLTPKQQTALHVSLLLVSFGVLLVTARLWQAPILPDYTELAGLQQPTLRVMLILGTAIGLPYVVLSTTSPLLQRWWGILHPTSPYKLYALSNTASLLALLVYPFVIEPTLPLATQGRLWTTGYVLTGILLMLAAVAYSRARKTRTTVSSSSPGPALSAARRYRTYSIWLSLSALSTMLLITGTNQLTQEVAGTPFLWLLPLALYLLSFIVVFNGTRWYSLPFIGLLVLVAMPLAIATWLRTPPLDLWSQVSIFSLVIFLGCTICHDRLYRTRPPLKELPWFYVMLASGSALGAIAAALIFPLLFTDHVEFPILIIILSFITLRALKPTLQRFLRARHQRIFSLLFPSLLLIIVFLAFATDDTGVLARTRNFYGVVKVAESKSQGASSTERNLIHGHILHGTQAINPNQHEPTTYYTETSGIGLAIAEHPKRQLGQPLRIGVLGLGVGTMASFCREDDDYFRFYEINPAVIELTQKYFTYVQHCPGKTDIVLGDGRLSLLKEWESGQPQQFDVLVMDAFTDDAIPLHLLTREAVELYLRHLAPDGVLAFNISNRHIDLTPVLAGHAGHFALSGIVVKDSSPHANPLATPSSWGLLTANQSLLARLSENSDSIQRLEDVPKTVSWTDAYSNLFRVLD